jgi:hypothetical protein
MNDLLILIPIFLGLGSFVMITIIVAVSVRAKQRRAEIYADVQTKLIDKFGSAPELLTFLKTDEGRQFLGEKSVVIGLLGTGFLIIGFLRATYNEFCIVVGFLLLALGLGMLLSSLLSLKLSRSWGLMEEDPAQPNA